MSTTQKASVAYSTPYDRMAQIAENDEIRNPPGPSATNEIDDNAKYLELYRKNLIVNYLPQFFTDEHLYELFIPFGPVHSVKIMRDSKTGYSYGFGFVNFLVDDDAEAAKIGLNGQTVANKRLKVSFARPSCEEIKDCNCYVRNLPENITDEQFVKMFGKFGIIVQKKLLRDGATGLPCGTAFVRYATRDQAAVAISMMNNFTPSGCTTPLRVAIAQDFGRQKGAYIAGFQSAITEYVYPSYSTFSG